MTQIESMSHTHLHMLQRHSCCLKKNYELRQRTFYDKNGVISVNDGFETSIKINYTTQTTPSAPFMWNLSFCYVSDTYPLIGYLFIFSDGIKKNTLHESHVIVFYLLKGWREIPDIIEEGEKNAEGVRKTRIK